MFQRVASRLSRSVFPTCTTICILSKGVWTGLPDILIGIMGLILFPFIAKWIRKFGTKKVLTRMIIVSMIGYMYVDLSCLLRKATHWIWSQVFGVDIPGGGKLLDHHVGVLRGLCRFFGCLHHQRPHWQTLDRLP